jgi:hypothetical protein
MVVRFVKTPGARDRVYCERPDGSTASWSFPSYGPDGMPHDLVHYAIERALGLTDGVFGKVAKGADLARINAAANRTAGRVAQAYADLQPLDQVLRSERLAAGGVADLTDPERALVRQARAELHQAWADLGDRGTLVLSWP